MARLCQKPGGKRGQTSLLEGEGPGKWKGEEAVFLGTRAR